MTTLATDRSFVELPARQRVASVLDPGTFREILGPFDRVESPHLEAQGIVPQADDGAVIGRGTIDGAPAVVVALDGRFQGGGVGEVSGAKLAAALEQTVLDHHRGVPTRPVLLLETGGIRLQEANLGMLAIADIHAALIELSTLTPVVGVITGTVGCFGGMGIAAGLASHLVMTPGGRLGLNGPEVIETEAGLDELDAADRRAVWSIIGGTQRVRAGAADELVEDDIDRIAGAVRAAFRAGLPATTRARDITSARARLDRVAGHGRPTPDLYVHLTTGAEQ